MRRVDLSVRWFVRWSVVIELISGKTSALDPFVYVRVWRGVEVGMWMEVGCPCPPVRNNTLTPPHFSILSAQRG